MMSRAQTSRVATQRELPDAGELGVLHIPLEVIPTGVVYKWVRLSTHGQIDEANWAVANQDGWKPVEAARHPELVPPPIPGRESASTSNAIIRAGMILMERPIELQRRYLRHQRIVNAERLQSVDRDRQVRGGDQNFVKESEIKSKSAHPNGGGMPIEE